MYDLYNFSPKSPSREDNKESKMNPDQERGPSFRITTLRREDAPAAKKQFRDDVVAGLSEKQKAISSKYFYDDAGSTLYAKITDLDEYYLTKAEQEIFETHSGAMVRKHLGSCNSSSCVNVVELGAGDGRKTKFFLRSLLKQKISIEYIPVDISRQAMTDLFEIMGSYFENDSLEIHGIVGDYMESLEHIIQLHPSRRTIVLFIGSSIGNYAMVEAKKIMKRIAEILKPRDLFLLGCDLQKDYGLMQNAYSDSEGVTRDFNLNLLSRMNRELGTTFKLDNFEHFATYNPRRGAMESYLVATRPHEVVIPNEENDLKENNNAHINGGTKVSFQPYESIYTECSYKYSMSQVKEMVDDTGYLLREVYNDSQSRFVDVLAEVKVDVSLFKESSTCTQA